MHEQENAWQNGITVKKTRDGYSWTIAVAADSNSPEALEAAAAKALDLDASLRRKLLP